MKVDNYSFSVKLTAKLPLKICVLDEAIFTDVRKQDININMRWANELSKFASWKKREKQGCPQVFI